MQGYNALWQPGTDHASIATEVKVIQSLKEQGINKADLTREEFLEKCWEWREEWFKKSVRDLRGFKVERWSNFTDLVKNSENRRLSSNLGAAYFSFSSSFSSIFP